MLLELRLGRHIKVLEVIYHLALVLSKGSAGIETAFMSTGAQVQLSSKGFSERYSSHSTPGRPGEESELLCF